MTTTGLLPDHGIIFRRKKHSTTVSCQCRASETKHSRNKGGGEFYEPMPSETTDNLFEVYNDPDNHWIPFGPEDRIKT